MSNSWYKEEPKSRVWWLDNGNEERGTMIFSFDKKKQYNLFADYPHKLTAEEKKIFDNDEPFWADFFSGRG